MNGNKENYSGSFRIEDRRIVCIISLSSIEQDVQGPPAPRTVNVGVGSAHQIWELIMKRVHVIGIKGLGCVVSMGLTLALASIAAGQMTIINTATTETLAKKSFYFEADVIFKPEKWDKGGFQTYGYRTVYGIDNKTEAGINFFYTRNGSTSPKELSVSIKRNFFASERLNAAAAAGATVYVPLNDSAGDRVTTFAYGNASKGFKRLRGLKLTGGVYRVFNGGRGFGTRQGVTAAIEQPLTSRISLVADWISGSNRFGYAAAGVNVQLTKRQFILTTFNVGNSGRGNNFFAIFYGYTY